MKSTLSHRVSGALAFAFACVIALVGCSGEQAPDDPAPPGPVVPNSAATNSAVTSLVATNLAVTNSADIGPAVDSANVAGTQLSAATSPFEGKDMAIICAGISEEVFFTMDKFGPRMLNGQQALLLRFAQSIHGHIADEDENEDDSEARQVTVGAMAGPSAPGSPPLQLESAQHFPHDYSDDVLDDLGNLIVALNECNRLFPSEFSSVTDDFADVAKMCEPRRFIDTLGG